MKRKENEKKGKKMEKEKMDKHNEPKRREN